MNRRAPSYAKKHAGLALAWRVILARGEVVVK